MFICTQCQTQASKWSGKCSHCGAWNTLEPFRSAVVDTKKIPHGDICSTHRIPQHIEGQERRYTSASKELDGVLGGGLMPGSLILLSGEPGIGKSTLSLQMSEWYSREEGQSVLYVSGEESIHQIAHRAHRLGIHSDGIELLAESNFENILTTIEASSAQVIVIDSLSVLSASSLEGSMGSVSQIRAMTEVCMQVAKRLQKSIILIGHVTKDGSISGPKSLEHLVDVVLYLEGIRTENYRILRAFKNRFGSTDAVGIFRMEQNGLQDMSDPGMEFIDQENFRLPGSALTMTVEGNRPILVEVEALTTYTKFGYPKRSVRGLPSGKLDLMIAVMTKYTDTKLESSDVYLNVARGMSLSDPGVDLACIAAMMSSKKNIPLGKTLFFGEVSLTGVIKNVFLLEKRLSEAAKLGFFRVIIPQRYEGKIPQKVEAIRVESVQQLLAYFEK